MYTIIVSVSQTDYDWLVALFDFTLLHRHPSCVDENRLLAWSQIREIVWTASALVRQNPALLHPIIADVGRTVVILLYDLLHAVPAMKMTKDAHKPWAGLGNFTTLHLTSHQARQMNSIETAFRGSMGHPELQRAVTRLRCRLPCSNGLRRWIGQVRVCVIALEENGLGWVGVDREERVVQESRAGRRCVEVDDPVYADFLG